MVQFNLSISIDEMNKQYIPVKNDDIVAEKWAKA